MKAFIRRSIIKRGYGVPVSDRTGDYYMATGYKLQVIKQCDDGILHLEKANGDILKANSIDFDFCN